MAKIQEEMNQCAHAANPVLDFNPPPIPPIVENPVLPPQGNPPVNIGTSDSVPSATLNPPVIEVDEEIKGHRGEAKSDEKY